MNSNLQIGQTDTQGVIGRAVVVCEGTVAV